MLSYLDFQYTEEEAPDLLAEPFNDSITYRENVLVINSSDRNKDKFPNPNNYDIVIKEPIEDICAITLLKGRIPSTQYNIHKYTNLFYFSEDIGEVISLNPIKRSPVNIQTICIPEGNYNDYSYEEKDLLSKTLEEEINKIAKKKYKITYNALQNKYNFKCMDKENSYFQIINADKKIPYGDFSYDKIIKRNDKNEIMYDLNGNKMYEDIFHGEYEVQEPKYSIARFLGFSNKNYDGLIDGKVSSDINNTRKIIGINTHFLQEIKINSFITVASIALNELPMSYGFQVINILNDNELIIDKDIEFSFEHYQIFADHFNAPFLRNLYPYNPIALQIPTLRRLHSSNPIINSSFCLFNNEQDYLIQGDDDFSITKGFNPPIGKLNKLRIKFFNTQYSGSYYDFGGKDHTLVFKIKTTKQATRYYNKNKS